MPTQQVDFLKNGLPLIGMPLFALVWWLADIYAATAALMMLMLVQVAILKICRRPVEGTTWALLALVLVLGSLTLIFREKAFIQLKTTIVYTLFALVLIISDYGWKKNLLQLALKDFFEAPAVVWRRSSVLLAGFFLVLALCNWLVARYLSESIWIGMKTFGFPLMTVLFVLVLVGCLWRYAKANDEV